MSVLSLSQRGLGSGHDLPQANEIVRDLVPSHLDFRKVVHANAHKVEVTQRVLNGDLVSRDLCLLGAGREHPIRWIVLEYVAVHFGVFSTYDQDIGAYESANSEPNDGDILDRLANRSYLLMLHNEIIGFYVASGDADASLRSRASETSTSIVFECLWRLWRYQSDTFADEGDAVFLDGYLLIVHARGNYNATAWRCIFDDI